MSHTSHDQRVRELEQQLVHYTECATRLQCECDRLSALYKSLETSLAEKERSLTELQKCALCIPLFSSYCTVLLDFFSHEFFTNISALIVLERDPILHVLYPYRQSLDLREQVKEQKRAQLYGTTAAERKRAPASGLAAFGIEDIDIEHVQVGPHAKRPIPDGFPLFICC